MARSTGDTARLEAARAAATTAARAIFMTGEVPCQGRRIVESVPSAGSRGYHATNPSHDSGPEGFPPRSEAAGRE